MWIYTSKVMISPVSKNLIWPKILNWHVFPRRKFWTEKISKSQNPTSRISAKTHPNIEIRQRTPKHNNSMNKRLGEIFCSIDECEITPKHHKINTEIETPKHRISVSGGIPLALPSWQQQISSSLPWPCTFSMLIWCILKEIHSWSRWQHTGRTRCNLEGFLASQ